MVKEGEEMAAVEKELVELAYQTHKQAFSSWREGQPVESWVEPGCDICVKYESGKWWHYRNLLTEPEWW